MKNKKLVFGIVSGVVVLALVGGGLLLMPKHDTRLSAQEQADRAAESLSANSQALPETQPQTAAPAVPVATDPSARSTSQSAQPVTNQGLQVQGGSALAGLGQGTSNNNAQSGTSSGANSPAANNPFDPKSFLQYDKYKSDKTALFADAQMGDGATLESGKKAVVYYRGWLTNGTLFDQSRADASGKLQTFSFTAGAHQVITGWEQGLIGMKVGGVRLLIVPPVVGYGAAGQGSIPPNSVLIFQVQLADVQ